jgi:hypothetical protein
VTAYLLQQTVAGKIPRTQVNGYAVTGLLLKSATSIFSFSARSANDRNCFAQTAPVCVENV